MWPEFNSEGDLPVGVHRASLSDVTEHFGAGTQQRRIVSRRLVGIFDLASSTRHLSRFIIFGSFVTAKPSPNDVDILGDRRCQCCLSPIHGAELVGASIFWLRRFAAIGGEQTAIEDWQFKRDGTRRGIVEVTSRD